MLRKALLILALVVGLGASVTWLVTGANVGWTKTSVPVTFIDEITGLEGLRYEDRFLPGLDFLGAGLLVAGILAGVGLLFRHRGISTTT